MTEQPASTGTAAAAQTPSPTPPSPERARYTLAEQIACAERELTFRYRVYAGRVRDGKMSEAERDREIGLMRAVRNTLRAILDHEDTIRAVIVAAKERARLVAEADELSHHPVVAALHEAFPGATLVGLDDPDHHDTEEQHADRL